MSTTKIGKGQAILLSLATSVFSLILSVLIPALPAHAASTVEFEWVNSTTVRFGGSALRSPVEVSGDFVGGVYGAPAGTQTFMAVSNGPVEMSFGCKVSMTLDIFTDANGTIDFSKGNLIFTTSSPSTCSQDTLKANINGLTHDPMTGTANISLMNVPINNVGNRGPASGTDSPDQQLVNITAGMGPASDYNNIPSTDTLMICEAKGDYVNNIDALYADCLAQKSGALSAPAITSNPLETIQDGKGPNGGDEKGWRGQFTGVKAGNYVACSANFKSCQLFTKNPGQVADVYVIYGAGGTIPGDPPGQGAPDKVCTTGEGLAGSIAWVLCPLVQLIANATSFFESNIIVPFMTVSPLTTNADNPVYILWQNIRNLANVGFIIFFFIVIFSQATSIGISNYGIKRILPKMVAVVIGVNLSYFLVAFVIDAFNIFGAGISQLVTAALKQAGTTTLTATGQTASTGSIFLLGGAALITIVVTAGAAIGWFFSFLLLALLVVVVVVLVLAVRQMAIIMLVIIAPVAILLYMLPNTEQYFTKWRKMLVQLLMMYPMIVLLFAAGKIFGIILQQPDFKLAGEGVSDDVAQAVRVILQFVVYVIPLVFLPATFAASGALMGRAYSMLANRAVQPRANRLREDMARGAGEAQMRLANNRVLRRVPGASALVGGNLRRNYVREQRQRNLQRAQEEYTAQAVGGSEWMQRRAAGVAGQQGRTRAAAYAAQVASKGRAEDIDNEMALLEAQMRRLGVDQKTFAGKASKYLEDPNDPKNQTYTSPNGQTFNFATDGANLQRALLNSAASQGEIKGIEAARLNSSMDQATVDDIIRRNDGKLKEKGGYHLATQFNLANGRMYETDDKGRIKLDANGNPAREITGERAMKAEMAKQRVIAMASSGANSVAQMKAGLLGDTAKLITNDLTDPSLTPDQAADRQAMHDAIMTLDPSVRKQLRETAARIVNNPNVMARSEATPDDIRKIGTI